MFIVLTRSISHKHITKGNIKKQINLINIIDEKVSFKS